MYNYGTAAEVLNTVFDVIEGGKAVEAANVAEVIADNGAKIFDITTSEAFAANGSAAAIGSTVSIAEGATAGTTAGAGALSMTVADAVAAVAPALGVATAGVAAGVGLYNLAPEFWTQLSSDLVDAGQTVGGKVMGLIMPDGTTALSGDTINTIKDALLNGGVFNKEYSNYESGEVVNTTMSTSGTGNEIAYNLAMMAHNQTGLISNPARFQELLSKSELLTGGLWLGIAGETFNVSGAHGIEICMWRLSSLSVNTLNVSININGNTASLQGVPDGVTVYQYWQNFFDASISGGSGTSSDSSHTFRISALNNWNISTKYTDNTQEGATLPRLGEDFQVTYPTWQPHEFPPTLPTEMPDYYPVSMPSEGITQDPAQEGANETDTQLNKLIELLFQSLPENNPDITPDPDPVPEPETDPVPDPTPPEPEPNPPDPNPPVPDPIPTIPLPTLDTTRADRMFTVYNPTDANVNSLGAFLWTSNVIEQIKKLWDDPMQAIISFHKIYGAPTVGSSQEIVLGYIESGVSAPVVTSQFCEVDCGSVTVPELLNNATSYAPFTSLHIYLPFIGIMELDTNECMKATLHVKYRIDVYTGTCIALIYVSRNPDLTHEQVLYTFSGNASQQLPLTSSSFGGAISALLGLAGAGVAVASGGALGVAAGAVSAAHSLTQEMVHINRSGGLSANAGILGSRTPYLILSRQYCSDANGYAGFYGYPSNKTVYIGNCNGYIKCKDVIFRGSCTQAEAEEIESLLKSGVYV